MEHKELWQSVLGELEVTLTRANFNTWFQHTSLISNEDGHIVIGVPNKIVKGWLETKFHNEIQDTLKKMHPATGTIEYRIGNFKSVTVPSRSGAKRSDPPAKTQQTALPIQQSPTAS